MPPPELPRLWPLPSPAELEAITLMADPVVRNLHITQAYHTLTVGLAGPLGEENVSWCAYATWASKTAGSFIRKEFLPGLSTELLQRADAVVRGLAVLQATPLGAWAASAGLQLALLRALERLSSEVARHIARGNLLVFAELGPLYLELLGTFREGRTDREALERLLSRLRPGPTELGGQEPLRRAFSAYHEALASVDAKVQAELFFLANALVGLHEQTRLQEAILAALHAPLRELFLEQLVEQHRATTDTGLVPRLPEGLLRLTFEPLATRLERLWRELSTRLLMRMELPDVSLRLGEDIPAVTPEQDFPPLLLRLEHPELVELMARLDRTPDDTAGSAARDWGDLGDRMNLIVDLFRTRQQDRLLYDQPFTFLQVETLRQGRVPHGRL